VAGLLIADMSSEHITFIIKCQGVPHSLTLDDRGRNEQPSRPEPQHTALSKNGAKSSSEGTNILLHYSSSYLVTYSA
jgi:hypothetical protein